MHQEAVPLPLGPGLGLSAEGGPRSLYLTPPLFSPTLSRRTLGHQGIDRPRPAHWACWPLSKTRYRVEGLLSRSLLASD